MATALAEEVIGRISDVSAEIKRQAATQEREAALLRREFGVLRDEVGVEHELRDLRTQVVKAQRSVPKVPAIEARLRAEANVARGETDQEFAALRKDLKEVSRTVCSLQMKHAKLPATMERMLAQMLQNCTEYEEHYEEHYQQHSTRTVFAPTITVEAAAALQAFAAQTLERDDGRIIEH